MLRLTFLMLLPLLAITQAALAARMPETHAHGALQAKATEGAPPVAAPRQQTGDAPQPANVLTAELDLDARDAAEPAETPAAPEAPQASATPPPATPASATPEATGAAAPRTGESENVAQTAPQKPITKEDRDTAAAIISGSRRPGVLDHQIIRANRPDKPEINISYPSLGTRDIDADIRQWATGIADAFDENFNTPGLLQDEDRPVPELWGSYAISYPSPNALSITFEIWTYAGGAHGNLDIMPLRYAGPLRPGPPNSFSGGGLSKQPGGSSLGGRSGVASA